MTGLEIYKAASAYLYERDNEDEESKEFSVPFLNTLLMEALPYENSIRLNKNVEELETAPLITDLSEDIDYHDSITRIALPYGLAALFFAENLDNYRGNLYRAQYLSALGDAVRITPNVVIDVYPVDGEMNG